MIEHPNLWRTSLVRLAKGNYSGMTRFRPLEGCGTPSATFEAEGFRNLDPFTALFTTPQTERRTQWVTRVPVRAVKIPGWLVRELPTSGEVTRRDKSPGD